MRKCENSRTVPTEPVRSNKMMKRCLALLLCLAALAMVFSGCRGDRLPADTTLQSDTQAVTEPTETSAIQEAVVEPTETNQAAEETAEVTKVPTTEPTQTIETELEEDQLPIIPA